MSAIVLAGGRSSRFGRDKLAEPVGEVTLLDRAIAAVRGVARDVLVVAAPGAVLHLREGVRLVHDERAFEGPLAGCLAGLTAAREPLVLVVGGDMPTLQPEVLGLLVRTLETSSAEGAVLEHQGERQHLPLALRTGSGTTLVRQLVAEGERRLGALPERLIVRVLAEAEWRPLDPDAATLRDVDEPGDLGGLRG